MRKRGNEPAVEGFYAIGTWAWTDVDLLWSYLLTIPCEIFLRVVCELLGRRPWGHAPVTRRIRGSSYGNKQSLKSEGGST